jgi:hypothetical protein
MKSKPAARPTSNPGHGITSEGHALLRRHLRFGWVALLVFLSLGIVLEALHAFKGANYLNPSHDTRRLMWTLAHAHGTLLGLVNLAFAVSAAHFSRSSARRSELASGLLRGATLLLPAGFFLGGFGFQGGDPGLGIALVPLGALLLLASVILTVLLVAR